MTGDQIDSSPERATVTPYHRDPSVGAAGRAGTAGAAIPTPSPKAQIRRWLIDQAPMPYLWTRQVIGRLTSADLRDYVIPRLGGVVATGPFAGMRYDAYTNRLGHTKLIGTYECELYEAIQRVVRGKYDRLINVGSADGYYAVGFGWAMPGLLVQAYDIKERCRENVRDLAILNGTESRTTVGGECTHQELQRFAGESVIVVCDIEGAELALLDPDAAPALRDYDIIVEIHDTVRGTEIHDRLVERFQTSHEQSFIRATHRSDLRTPALPWWFSRGARSLALDEFRLRPVGPTQPTGREWGVFWSRTGRQ